MYVSKVLLTFSFAAYCEDILGLSQHRSTCCLKNSNMNPGKHVIKKKLNKTNLFLNYSCTANLYLLNTAFSVCGICAQFFSSLLNFVKYSK